MTSESRDFIIIIIADAKRKGRGFKAKVNFLTDTMQVTNEENMQQNEPKTKTKSKKSGKAKMGRGMLGGLLQGILWIIDSTWH